MELLLFVATTTTSTVPATPGAALELVGPLVRAFQDRNWVLAAGLALALIVWALRTFGVLDKVKLGSKWGVRFSVLVLSALTAVALGLQAGLGWFDIASAALQAATAAIGGWEFLGKFLRDVLGKKQEAPPPAEPPGD